MRETLVLLHGFTQTGRSWDPVLAVLGEARYRPVAPDLRGHGDAGAMRPIGFDEIVDDVLGVAGDDPFPLVPDAGHALPWEKPAAIAEAISGARDS